MLVDLICVGVVALFALAGYFSGFLAQLGRLVALAAAYVVARPLGELLLGPVSAMMRTPRLASRVIAVGLAFLLAYAILSTLVMFALRAWRRGRPQVRSSLDALAGALFGGAKGALLVIVLLSALTLADQGPLGRALGRLGWRQSWAAGRAREHNALEAVKVPVVGDIQTLRRLRTDAGLRLRAARDPAVRRLLAHPKVRRLLNDRKLVASLERGEVSKVLADPRVDAALRDPELRKLLGQVDLRKLSGGQRRGRASRPSKAP